MFRILIVEDIKNTLEQLKALLSEIFPDSKIDTAETVKEGLELIKEASARHLPYDVVVLDFMLPREKGVSPEPDAFLCQIIRETMPMPLVLHITAYPDDVIVLQHMYNIHHDRRDAQGELVSKLEVDWPITLVAKMKAYLYGNRIEAQMDELFGPNGQSAGQARDRAMYSRMKVRRSLTHELAALNRDIVAHWDDLDERLKTKIQNTFHVDTESDPIRISLL